MRITDVQVRLLQVDDASWYRGAGSEEDDRPRWLFPLIGIVTDEGLVGRSMSYGKNGDGPSEAAVIRDVIRPALLGEDPNDIELIWRKLIRLVRNLRATTEAVVGSVDVALWDLKGQAAGIPIHRMLGGLRRSVPAYRTASRFLASPADVFDEATQVKADGFHGYKLQDWAGASIDIPRYRAAREAVGPDFALMEDAVGGYDFPTALAVGRVLDELEFKWFEEPIRDEFSSLLASLSGALSTPLLVGESRGIFDLPSYVRDGIPVMLRGDVHTTSGITGLRKAASLAEIAGHNFEIHTCATPLLDIANLHVACAITSGELFESHQPAFRFGIEDDPLTPDSFGMVHVPQGPGLGVALDLDQLDSMVIDGDVGFLAI